MIRRAQPALGTYVEIGIADVDDPCHPALDHAFQAIREIESLMSFHRRDSELSLLNANPGQWRTLHRHTFRVLTLARALGLRSGERFNVTVGGSLVKRGLLPALHAHDFLERGVADDIELQDRRVRWRRPVLVTLDGIAKGYAVDRAIFALKSCGVGNAWVNAGGDLRAIGTARLDLSIRGTRGGERLKVENMAVATSQSGRRANAHFPSLLVGAQRRAQTLTVAARYAWRADALTKIAACANASQRAQILAQFKGRML